MRVYVRGDCCISRLHRRPINKVMDGGVLYTVSHGGVYFLATTSTPDTHPRTNINIHFFFNFIFHYHFWVQEWTWKKLKVFKVYITRRERLQNYCLSHRSELRVLKLLRVVNREKSSTKASRPFHDTTDRVYEPNPTSELPVPWYTLTATSPLAVIDYRNKDLTICPTSRIQFYWGVASRNAVNERRSKARWRSRLNRQSARYLSMQ